MTDLQTVLFRSDRGTVVARDNAADILPRNRDRDVLVTASYSGVLQRGGFTITCRGP